MRVKMFRLWDWQVLVINLLLAAGLPASATTTPNDVADDRPSNGPIITPERSEIILQMGQNFTMYCRGKRKLQIKQEAVPEDSDGPFRMNMTDELRSLDPQNPYRTALHLYNVDRQAIGYYACFDDTITNTDFLIDIKEEPQNTEHISYIYVYVNGSNTLFAPMREVVFSTYGSDIVIGCRPTTPDVKITLNMDSPEAKTEYEIYNVKYSPKVGYLIDSDNLSQSSSIFNCGFKKQGLVATKEVFVHQINYVFQLPELKISGGSKYYLEGETFTLSCRTKYVPNSAVMLTWSYPPADESRIQTETNDQDFHIVQDSILYNNITITQATKENAGNYTCTITTVNKNNKSTSFEKKMVTAFIKLEGRDSNPKNRYLVVDSSEGKMFRFKFIMRSYPTANITYLKDSYDITHNDQFIKEVKPDSESYILTIPKSKVNHTGNYTLFASNGYLNNSFTYIYTVHARPVIEDTGSKAKYFVKNTVANVRCDITGYPLPTVSWKFVTENGNTDENIKGTDTVRSLYELTSIFNFKQVQASGNLTCVATNKRGTVEKTTTILVYDIYGGFGITNDNTWFSENENVELICLGSKYDYDNVTWIRSEYTEYDNYLEENVEYSLNQFSIIAKLKLDRIRLGQAGNYTCVGFQFDEENRSESIQITVTERRPIEFQDPSTESSDIETYEFLPVSLTCMSDAVPRPKLLWFKDGQIMANSSEDVVIQTAELNYTSVKSTLYIQHMEEKHKGKYECVATNLQQNSSRYFDLNIKEKMPFKAAYIAIIVVTFFLLILLVLYLSWRIRKEKKKRKEELAAAGLLYFVEGAPGSLNPDLGIDEQVELLPYDPKFEFPAKKLKLDKQLGAGAFGVVYKAEARGILNAEETTVCAVKMVKKTADNMYIKALASELKIMVHLGKHINIVNLLGACTKNVGKRELIVIVEYCKYGCIHTYLQKHRQVFIDQLTDSKEKGFGRVNRGFSSSSANSGGQSDYFGYSNQTQGTDNTFLNSANTNRSARKDNPSPQMEPVKASETGYIQPEWRSNYESDYSYNGCSPTPLCSRDLLCWAFQIARGMEYLASRKILHGDLAARNILLAEDNVVKICDFGLARSIYKNDEYLKKENSPVPVRWLAIECLVDSIFSTQSDVWSYGVVLWELFSLAKTPYPNINLQDIRPWLIAGNRLEKPRYADEQLYKVMLRCWDQKPINRPSFSELQEIFGSFLEDNVRNHYIDLNSPYNMMNSANHVGGVEDYLTMVSPPDYNHIVIPSPHQYVNNVNSFFPPPSVHLQHDDEGYLQMSPARNQAVFSSPPQDTQFDFDPRKLSPRIHTPTSSQSEITPMLTLNMPTSGSESDHDGNTSPYLKMQRIEEEDNDVFEKSNNVKNASTNIAVSNPTYIGIEFDTDLDKKKNIAHYVNTSAPNGLVK